MYLTTKSNIQLLMITPHNPLNLINWYSKQKSNMFLLFWIRNKYQKWIIPKNIVERLRESITKTEKNPTKLSRRFLFFFSTLFTWWNMWSVCLLFFSFSFIFSMKPKQKRYQVTRWQKNRQRFFSVSAIKSTHNSQRISRKIWRFDEFWESCRRQEQVYKQTK